MYHFLLEKNRRQLSQSFFQSKNDTSGDQTHHFCTTHKMWELTAGPPLVKNKGLKTLSSARAATAEVWQWRTFVTLAQHQFLELQLLSDNNPVSSARFASSMFNDSWSPMTLKTSAGGSVHCYVKLRGLEFLEPPFQQLPASAPPPDPEAATRHATIFTT